MKHFLAFFTVVGLLLAVQTVLADANAAPTSQTTETPMPTLTPESPWGAPGRPSAQTFRRYYQVRCYPGCHEVQKGPTPTPAPESPWGAPGEPSARTFRRYYQIRCYPGCHEEQKGPMPTRIHP